MEIVLAWLRSSTPALVPIIEVSTVAQLEDSWQGVGTRLDADEVLDLDQTG
ncbi:MAG: hypothetical protein U0R67_05000 [Micropruina glycogenica]